MRVYVTLSGSAVAVADSQDKAERQIFELVRSNALQTLADAKEMGEARSSTRIRVCYVEVNQ